MVTIPKLLLLVPVTLALSGCYYIQAVNGHVDLMRKREPVDDVIADASTPPELARRLELVQEARDFSIAELALPDNDSYRSYADLERDQVLWNLFAAPEFSLKPKTWCYPFLGCLGYRGYFSANAARKRAERLEEQGFDVAMGGVAAYSTLGRFDDPVLNTMMRWDDARLAALLFHELAHQVVYIKNDTSFNESFATAVEEIGIELWLERRDDKALLDEYRQRKRVERDILEMVEAARADLEVIYTDGDEARMRAAKHHRFERLSADVARRLAEAGLPQTHWLSGQLNNAKLIPLALYEAYVPSFRALYVQCERDFDCFYSEVARLGGLDAASRGRALERLATEPAGRFDGRS